MTMRAAIVIFIVFTLVSSIHLLLFGFRSSDDASSWITVSDFFVSGFNTNVGVCLHCIHNPFIPLLISILRLSAGQSVVASYFVVNYLTIFFGGVLFYRLTLRLTRDGLVSFISTVLFLVDFLTQYNGYSIMPDAVTWFMLLGALNLAMEFWRDLTKLNLKLLILAAVFSSMAILTKTSLGFIVIIFPILIFLKHRINWLRATLLFCLIIGVITGLYYLFTFGLLHSLPWNSLVSDSVIRPNIGQYFYSIWPTYFYLWPFIIIGAMRMPFLINYRRAVAVGFVLTLIPIFLWPYEMPRFTFTTFWVIFPIIASGIAIVTKRRIALVAVALVVILSLQTLRMHLTLSRQTHFQLIHKVLENI